MSRVLAALAALAMGCGAEAARLPRPAGAVAAWQRAVSAGDAAAVHAMLSREQRERMTVEDVTRLLGDNREELREIAGAMQVSARAATPHARARLGDGERVDLVLSGDRWAIERGALGEPALAVPEDAIRALRRALARRSLPQLLRVLARSTRAEVDAEIERLLDETADELDLQVEVRGDEAVVRLTGGRQVVLVRESGEWRVRDVR